jgi:hypothetical protein
VPFRGFWLSAPLEVLEGRIRERARDASDATVEVVRRQIAGGEPETSWTRLDAGLPLDALVEQARAAIVPATE